MNQLQQLSIDEPDDDDELDKTVVDEELGLEIARLAELEGLRGTGDPGHTLTNFRPNIIDRVPAEVQPVAAIQNLITRWVRVQVIDHGFLRTHDAVGASEAHLAALDKLVDETVRLDSFWRFGSVGF
jgi:hypothetical protein